MGRYAETCSDRRKKAIQPTGSSFFKIAVVDTATAPCVRSLSMTYEAEKVEKSPEKTVVPFALGAMISYILFPGEILFSFLYPCF